MGSLGDVLLGRVPGRSSGEEITLFDALGLAVEGCGLCQVSVRRKPQLNGWPHDPTTINLSEEEGNRHEKCIALLLTGVMLLGLLSGCNTYQNDDSASSAGSTSNTADGVSADFTMAYNGVVTLNPIMSQSSNDFNLFYLTQIQLVRFYGDELQYDAAERYEVSDDYTVYTFHLRDGLKWSDGQALYRPRL